MARRDGVFAGDSPLEIFRRWLEEAKAAEVNDPDAVALATVGPDGLPNVRMVLLRGVEDDGFVFYTNYRSVKAREIEGSGKAAFVAHWKSIRRQARVRGEVSREDGALADRYFASRSPESRLGAWASRQSEPLEDRETLMSEVERIRREHVENPPRPPFWGGFRIRPLEIELWADGKHRLHDRFRWTREGFGAAWEETRLSP